ncbi:tRNA uridine(34) 5-carboxymethylaminomethyl modification radical SAM/GNAT enzyme Elp3 [Methanogenium marinum]|uniref:tRNA carboxymethyluridine synthase n=1 Tax=Methanogenium marinum TaxID=348610 RepID=A0A9Q4KR66_9EURY|nr:tRNA uridine(34) 5-carboxymethylaminomethyl modification radical SAM/GNAT enzyme Elp3 [Methanogenium marinum]MDE4907064.1 tRNA uridine(34) 5-carboxymethylaminomethyl modification radical SAM/GNAT enzyme Elp3 [Methanogenium marinum]
MQDNAIFREIISRLSFPGITSSDVQKVKIQVAKEYRLSIIPKNSVILAAATDDEFESMRLILQVKPTRTLSGVAPVAVMTSPHPCPHGKCLPCPGGPDHPFGSPQSYTGEEPAALRGRQFEFDPYVQVRQRLLQFELLGHHTDKVELIVMGGTMTARDPAYQEYFMGSCIRAMNEFGGAVLPDDGSSYEEVCRRNETARARCIAATFETRPDWCKQEHIDSMLLLGVTKVELGVQQLRDDILEYNRRGHGIAETISANTHLRDAGIKVGFHVMPNLPSATMADDRWMFEELFCNPSYRPDFLKIYPTLVTPGSEIEALWEAGGYATYPEEDLIDLIAFGKSCIPEYTRLQRVQRDIPAKLIVSGSHHSNFRQLAQKRLKEMGGSCRCIRCREAGRNPTTGEAAIETMTYECCGGTEHFISITASDSLIGFVRLRYPGNPWRTELSESAIIRELHVYGSLVPLEKVGTESGEWQHRQYGACLLQAAEDLAASDGYLSVAVMSGIGVRPYYARHGYERSGPYMVKRLG